MTAKALFLTAYNRPDLLERTMRTWEVVRGVTKWPFFIMIEPGPMAELCRKVALDSLVRMGHPESVVIINPERYGVLHHPWVGFEGLFGSYEFVVRAEDDLCVSDDVLEYFEWAEEHYRPYPQVATIHAYTDGPGTDPAVVRTLPEFNPWIWGTWRKVWQELIGPTWDHDYSTFNDYPGNQSGWDWNLNSRIFPKHGRVGVFPEMSRVDNIGVNGIHGTAANFRTAETFQPVYGDVAYGPECLK